jgi:hypothetical protein
MDVRAMLRELWSVAWRALRRVGLAGMLAALLLSGLLAQVGQAGIGSGMIPTAHARGLRASSVSALNQPNASGLSVQVHAAQQSTDPTDPSGPVGPTAPITPASRIPHGGAMPMQAGRLALSANQASHFSGSDGRLSVDVPAGAVSAADLSLAGGALSLAISQIDVASGSNAGGSGHVSLGTYLLQLVDSSGVLVSHGLHKPVTLTLHYGARESAVDIAHTLLVLNTSLPDGVALAPTSSDTPRFIHHAIDPAQQAATEAAPAAAAALGPLGSMHTAINAGQHTLTASAPLNGPSTAASWDTDSPVATFGRPDPFNVDLNAGSLTASYPISVPPGPGGLTPPLALTYSSASVSEQHNAQAPAPWVGEGWNLSLGAITWAEHNSNANCSGCGNGWEDSWQLVDAFGTAEELIPPNINVATYYEDSLNSYCGQSSPPSPPYPCPVQWHTATETHTKIYSYIGPNGTYGGTQFAKPPCFRVWLSNGIMEEFGCTPDSHQYYPEPVGSNFATPYQSAWLLDLITDPLGNQIHVTYAGNTDMEFGAGNNQYPRDIELATVEYD